jgi:hypothetical protein
MMWCLSSAAEALENRGKKIVTQVNTSPRSTLCCRANEISAHRGLLEDDSLKLPIFVGSKEPRFLPKEEDERNDAAMLLTSIMSIATQEIKEEFQTCSTDMQMPPPTMNNVIHNRMRAVSIDCSRDKDLKSLSFANSHKTTSPSPTLSSSLQTTSSSCVSPETYYFNALPAAVVTPQKKQQLPLRKRLWNNALTSKDTTTTPRKKIILHRKFSWRSFPEVNTIDSFSFDALFLDYNAHIHE